MASLAQLMVKVGADISEFSRQMNTVSNTMKDTGKGLMNVGKSVGDAGSKMAQSVTLPIMALATSAIVVGASFDKQMSKVKAISGATGDEFDLLRKKALDLGSSTSFSSREVASAMEELASAGFTTNQILDSTSGVLSLASSAGIGLAEASAIAGGAINGFGLEAENAGHVADVLAKASAISATNATGLGEAFKYIAPVASSLGISLEETASAIGIMANAGIDGSQAGTTLRSGLLNLASPTEEMGKLMKSTGSEFFDANGKMKSLSGILGTLKEATKGMTDEQKTSYLATLFGKEAVSGFMALLNEGTGTLDKNTEALKNSNGEAKKMADTMNGNLAGSWDNLTGALEALAISFSDVFKGDLQKLADKITDLANKFNELSPTTKKIIGVIALLVAGIAPLLIVIGLVAQGVGALMIVFGAMTAPIWIAIGVIVALIAIGVLLWAKWDEITAFLEKTWNKIKTVASSVWGAIVDYMSDAWNKMKDSVTKTWDKISDFLGKGIDFVKGLFNKLLQFFLNYTPLGYVIKTIIANMDAIKKTISIGLDMVKAIFTLAWKVISDACGVAWDWIKNKIQTVSNAISSVITPIWNSIKNFFTTTFNAVKTIVTTVWDGIKTKITTVASAVWDTVKTKFNAVKEAITTPIESAKDKVIGIVDKIKSAFANLILKIPKPKIPKVNVTKGSKSIAGVEIPYPKFDISWNAKGGIFNGASILGGGQGVGEKGAEAVLPIQHKRYMAPFAKAVADNLPMNERQNAVVENIIHTTIELDGEVVGRKVEKFVSRQQLDNQKRKSRVGGR